MIKTVILAWQLMVLRVVCMLLAQYLQVFLQLPINVIMIVAHFLLESKSLIFIKLFDFRVEEECVLATGGSVFKFLKSSST